MTTPLDQMLATKFHAAKNAFDERWQTGVYEWLQANSIGTMVTLTLTEQQLDSVWAETRRNPSRLADFEAALARWQQAHVVALKEFLERSGQ